MPRSATIAEIGAGASIGTLIGLIMGLSASPVVSTVLGALATGLLGMLGVRSLRRTIDGDRSSSNGPLRILGFGFFCAVFLVVGILLRTHGTLAPSLATQERELKSSHSLSASEVHQILLLKAFGVTRADGGNGAANLAPVEGKNVAANSAPVLFDSKLDVCQVMRRDQYHDLSSYIESLRNHGGEYAILADAISHGMPQDQESIASSLSKLLCP